MINLINIVSASDNNYIQHYGVMIVSLFENKRPETIINLYLIDNHISNANKNKILSIVNKYKSTINFVSIDHDLYKNCVVNGHITDTAYYRLSIQSVVPKHIDKILYLDCDIVILEDLSNLWNIDICNHSVGIVKDIEDINYENRKLNLNLPRTSIYFNDGVMLINLKNWRSFDIEKVSLAFIYNNKEKLNQWDQDVLNALLYDNCLQIPEKYNYMVNQYYERKTCISPSIVHFIGHNKPWHYTYDNKYKSYYYKFLRKSPWKFYIPQDLTYINVKYKFLNKHQNIFIVLKSIKHLLSRIVTK